MEIAQAQELAEEVVAELRPYCNQIQIAGSIRRRRPFCHDIDIVLIPGNQGQLAMKLKAMGCNFGGNKLARLLYKGAQVDIYFATPETWATLLLIRTGSKENNIRLCTAARAKGMKLKADGQGLLDENGNVVARYSEQGIYESLGLPYQEPWER